MRDGMNRQDYINAILEQIDSKQMQAEIEKELSAHIDDREEYYREIGYDSDTAAEKAVERMGSPEAAADGFLKVHKKRRLITAILAVMSLLSSIIIIHLFWIILVIFFVEKSTMGAGIAEAIFLIYVIGLSFIGKKRNSRFICFIAVIDFIMTYGAYFFISLFIDDKICSHIIFKLACLLTLDFECLNTFCHVIGISVAPYLTYLSVAFCIAVLVLLILVFASVCMLKKPTYSLRTKRFTKRVFKTQKTALIFIALTMLLLPSFSSFDKDKGMTVKTPENVDKVIIAQSDTPRSVSEIPTEDILIIDSTYFFGVHVLEMGYFSSNNTEPKNIDITSALSTDDIINGKYIKKQCGNKLKYSVIKTDIPCAVTKDYVYIEFFDSNKPNFNNEFVGSDNVYKFVSDNPENWYEVESAGEISAAVDGYNQVEITVSKKSP